MRLQVSYAPRNTQRKEVEEKRKKRGRHIFRGHVRMCGATVDGGVKVREPSRLVQMLTPILTPVFYTFLKRASPLMVTECLY